MPTTEKTQEIAAAFQRYVKYANTDNVANYQLKELQDADYDLGWRDQDSGYRLALKDRIAELKDEKIQRRQSRIRALDYVVTLVIALIVLCITMILS